MPPTESYHKTFDVTMQSTPAMWYRIEVSFRGVVVEVFEYRTMREACMAFSQAGYRGPVTRWPKEGDLSQ